jgi:hypothetical protein
MRYPSIRRTLMRGGTRRTARMIFDGVAYGHANYRSRQRKPS